MKKMIAALIASAALLAGLAFMGLDTALAQTPSCGGVDTAIIECDPADGSVEGSGLWQVLIIVINILTAGVGIAAVAGVVFGAFLYTTAGGNPEQVKKAIGMITNVVIGVIAYAGMYIFLNFIIPGGLFT